MDKDGCNVGYYPDWDERVCIPCHSRCKTCFNGTEIGCLSCKENSNPAL